MMNWLLTKVKINPPVTSEPQKSTLINDAFDKNAIPISIEDQHQYLIDTRKIYHEETDTWKEDLYKGWAAAASDITTKFMEIMNETIKKGTDEKRFVCFCQRALVTVEKLATLTEALYLKKEVAKDLSDWIVYTRKELRKYITDYSTGPVSFLI